MRPRQHHWLVAAVVALCAAACSDGNTDVAVGDSGAAAPSTSSSTTVVAPSSSTTTHTTETTAPPTSPSPEPLFGGEFTAVEATEDGRPYEFIDGSVVTLRFEHRPTGDVIAWRGGCNAVGGAVEVTADRLLVGDELAGSAAGCDPAHEAQDGWLARLMTDDPQWAYDAASGRLTVRGVTVPATVVFERGGASPPTPPPPDHCGEPGSETDLSGEPEHHGDYLRRWSNADGCPVRLDVLVTHVPPPDFHCGGWPPDLAMGTPLGTPMPESESRIYVRDPDGYFNDPELQAGFAQLPGPPPGASDTGYRQGDVELWMDALDDSFVYLVAPGGTERWPKAEEMFGCA